MRLTNIQARRIQRAGNDLWEFVTTTYKHDSRNAGELSEAASAAREAIDHFLICASVRGIESAEIARKERKPS